MTCRILPLLVMHVREYYRQYHPPQQPQKASVHWVGTDALIATMISAQNVMCLCMTSCTVAQDVGSKISVLYAILATRT